MQTRVSFDRKYKFPHPPVVIGGLGGSGTRLVAAILQQLEFDMGSDLNRTNDNLAFTFLFKRPELWPLQEHAPEIHQAMAVFFKAGFFRTPLEEKDILLIDAIAKINSLQHPTDWLEKRLENLKEYSKNLQTPTQWGWKEPNTHIFLPALVDCIPEMKYIHVMRHGLDMANSTNQSQVNLWGNLLIGKKITGPAPEVSFRYWCAVHRRILQVSQNMHGRFFLLNFDNFCFQPEKGLAQLLNYLQLKVSDKVFSGLVQMVNPPTTIGRYKTRSKISARAGDVELLKKLGFEYY